MPWRFGQARRAGSLRWKHWRNVGLRHQPKRQLLHRFAGLDNQLAYRSTEVTVVLNFTFPATSEGRNTVMTQPNYYSGSGSWESLGILTVTRLRRFSSRI